MNNWHEDFAEVIAEAHFRAAIVRVRYRVYYDARNRLWNLLATNTPLAATDADR